MISYVATGILFLFLRELGSDFGRYVGVLVFAANLNILYLQSIGDDGVWADWGPQWRPPIFFSLWYTRTRLPFFCFPLCS